MSARVMTGSIFCEMSDKSLWTTFYHKLEDFGPSFWAHKHAKRALCAPPPLLQLHCSPKNKNKIISRNKMLPFRPKLGPLGAYNFPLG
jgi:hypothetical protein